MSARQRPRRLSTDNSQTRLTFKLPASELVSLERLAASLGYHKVTTVVRAHSILATLVDAESHGATITINHVDGSKEKVMLK